MTAEVALLNKSAIALAADSATTVTYWHKNESVTRYFKGANKVFNLSKLHPVGVMTFASANLLGVPWELIIKSYREHLGVNSHDHLRSYAIDFFNFIAGNRILFPQEMLEKQFVALADRVAASIVLPLARSEEYKAADGAGKREILQNGIAVKERIDEDALIPGVNKAEIEEQLENFTGRVAKVFREDDYYKIVIPDVIMESLARAGIIGIYSSDFRGRDTTGLAFAGYGASEYFPRLEQYNCHGLILGKPYFAMEQEISIGQGNTSDFLPLAKSEMIETFVKGASIESMVQVHRIMVKRLNEMEEGLKAAGLLDGQATIDDLKEKMEKAFRDEVVDHFYVNHQQPVRQVIANLPINELADLAETLVYMESLKERVTTPEESVSGAIDVAVISKHDGFIWIKRKHYFKQELNHRFFVKQQRD